MPFRAPNEYLTFKKILALEYEVPEGFPDLGRDLVQQLLLIDPAARLGADQRGGLAGLKAHPFFTGIEWESLHRQTPPKLDAFLPARTAEDQPLHGCDDDSDELADLIAAAYRERSSSEVYKEREREREK